MRQAFPALMSLATVMTGCSTGNGWGEEEWFDAVSGSDPVPSSGEEETDPGAQQGSPGMPVYSAEGQLVRRDDWQTWVFMGAGLNLAYPESTLPPVDLFTNVFMEPSAFAHYKETGEFREGTMTALAVYLAGTGSPPSVSGQYAEQLVAFEMSVKDAAVDVDAHWQYYSFAEDSSVATANPPETCFACHTEHARTDHVFSQFYPILGSLTQ